jgi:hypothetical protein
MLCFFVDLNFFPFFFKMFANHLCCTYLSCCLVEFTTENKKHMTNQETMSVDYSFWGLHL